MSKYEPRITETNDCGFYTLIVRIDRDGEENVIHGFAKYYKKRATAEKRANAYIAKHFE